MGKSRGKKALINTIVGILSELVSFVCGLILPRLILSAFGSSYNGIVSSITQFISCISLMQAGVGGVTRAALYKPLSENNNAEISAIVNQTERFMKKIAIIFIAFTLVFASLYPFLVSDEFEWLFSFTLIIIISLSTFAQYYFGLTYQMLLNADQKQYIPTAFTIASTILNTLVSVIIIKAGGSIHVVKLGSSIVFVISPIIMCVYAKRKYNIDKHIHAKTDLIKQRWDAMGHEIAAFINNNTDIMVLTVFSTLSNVSIYTVYHSVIIGIRKVVINFVTGFGAAFGNMYALEQYDLMEENLRVYEIILYSLTTVVYSVTLVLITPFAMLYTSGINDANYYQPLFAAIITLAGAFSCFRYPYQTIVQAVGHFKQTRNGAFVEAGLNIVLSIVLVIKFGIIGVAIGTLVAAIFRTMQYGIYLEKNIIKRAKFTFCRHIILSLGIIGVMYVCSYVFMKNIDSVFSWVINAVVLTCLALLLTIGTDFLFYRKDTIKSIKKIKAIVHK